jgi:fructose-1,6-bisphosphatase/inositol monophosphatase family enzyme
MQQTKEFFDQAQAVIMAVLDAAKPEILATSGNVAEEIKEDKTPVTALDKKLEEQLREALTKFDASIPIIGEEYGGDTENSSFWLVDPIDGTESFIRGLPFMRNMVTLIDNNEPVFALVNKPVTNDLFTAVKDKGAFKNGEKLQVSNRPLGRAWIELSVTLSAAHSTDMLLELKKKINGFRQYGDFSFVAEGKVDGILHYKPGGQAWDYAPRGLLLKEAGARVENIGTDSYDYRNFDFVAANPVIFDDVMQVIIRTLANSDASS